MKKYFIYILLIVMSGLVLLTGCRWFADNPMFPTGKFEVSYKVLKEDGEEATNGILGVVSVTDITSESNASSSSTVSTEITESDIHQEGEKYVIVYDNQGVPYVVLLPLLHEQTGGGYETIVTTELASSESYLATIAVNFARVVEFSFSPINNVGAEIQDCEVVYTDNKGMPIDSLRKNLSVYLYLPPFGSSEELEKDASRTLKLEIFDQSTQDYYINHNIPFGQAIITFNGLDGAGHPIALKKAISINADMIDDSLQDEIDQQIQEIMQNQGQNPGSSCSSCS
ncbi:hypothetical protein [Atribacter sp.]|jgi:hypothetical protein|uniref:hypothetical protein n=1 Tax=Atribacter sp. TaxID=2847780 RepID=UPI00345E260C